MTWDHHTDYLKSKLCKALGMLRRCQRLLPIQQKLMMYNALFASHLLYCHLVWSNSTKQPLDHLVTLKKRALRAITDVPYNAHTRDLFL
uniref:Tick transposon n=1 Tax=Rhipicephalus appendiculatus TaxID=34631 RepID=A0A131YUE2_RHIAP